jgi:hypothetical protein
MKLEVRMKSRDMTKQELLAAELYNYSYDHYADHIEIGNERFTRLMPETIQKLKTAEREKWPGSRIAAEIEIEENGVDRWLEKFRRAKDVVFAKNASESFRRSVSYVLKDALARVLNNQEAIDDLVIQICYRAADFGYLLDLEGKKLSDYSEWLRREKDVDYSGIGLPNLE